MTSSSDHLLPAGTSINGVELVVADLRRAMRFYSEAIGLHPSSDEAGTLSLTAGVDGPPLLILRESPGAAPHPPHTTGLYHVAILFPNRTELANAATRVIYSGVPLAGAADHLVSEALYLDDPDGNGVELYVDRPRSEWPYRNGQLVMDTLPLDVSALLESAHDWGVAAPATTRVGHVHLQVADLARSRHFYGDVLGFEPTTQLGRRAAFLSAGKYHHHIGLNTWAGEGAPQPPVGSAGLRGFTIAIPTVAALQAAQSRLRAVSATLEPISGEAAGFEGWATRDPDGNLVRLAALRPGEDPSESP